MNTRGYAVREWWEHGVGLSASTAQDAILLDRNNILIKAILKDSIYFDEAVNSKGIKKRDAHLRPVHKVRKRFRGSKVPVVEGEYLGRRWSAHVGKQAMIATSDVHADNHSFFDHKT